MVKNPEILKKFEEKYLRDSNLTLQEKFCLYDSMWELVRNIGVLPNYEPQDEHLRSTLYEDIEQKYEYLRLLRNADRIIKENRSHTEIE